MPCSPIFPINSTPCTKAHHRPGRHVLMDHKNAAHIKRASTNIESSSQTGSNKFEKPDENPSSELPSLEGKIASRKEKPPLSPYDAASWLSKAVFHWPLQIINLCLDKDRLNPHSVPPLNRELESSRNSASFVRAFEGKELTVFMLWKCIFTIYWKDNLFLVFAHLMEILGNIMSTLSMTMIIDNLNAQNNVDYQDLFRGVALSFSGLLIKAFANQHLTYRATITGAKVKVGLTAFLYSRLLNMKVSCGVSSAKVVNFVSNDLQRYENVFPLLHYTYMPWLEFIITIGCINSQLKDTSAAVSSAVVILVLFALQMMVSFRMVSVQEKLSLARDEMVKVISDTFSGILPIKCFNWQGIFEGEIRNGRKKVDPYIRKMNILEGVNTSLHFVAPNLSLFFVCFIMVKSNNGQKMLDESKATILNALFTLSSFSMSYLLPIAIAGVGQINVTHKRFIEICDAIEIGEDKQIEYSIHSEDDACIRFKNVAISWNRVAALTEEEQEEQDEKQRIEAENPVQTQDSDIILSIRNLSIQKGEFVALVGSVGTGKTTFLLSLLDETNISPSRVGGCLSLCHDEKISYSPQVPWLLSGSIRENILLGRPLDEQQYRKVLTTCCLDKDLASFPEGDLKHVGERGSSLSGGQRARVSLARMFYAADASIYLLDDVMSAVDGKVANELFRNISMFLQEAPKDIHSLKTCIIATHQLQFLPKFDKIIVLGDGKIDFFGDYAQLQASDCEFSKALAEFESRDGKEEESESEYSDSEESESEIDLSHPPLHSIISIPNSDLIVGGGKTAVHSRFTSSHPIEDVKQDQKLSPHILNLTNVDEQMSTGEVSLETYKKFLFASKSSWRKTAVIFFISILCQVCINFFDIFLNDWSKLETAEKQNDFRPPLKIGILTLCIISLLYLRAHLFLMRIADSAQEIFYKMVRAVMHTNMSFFMQNPQGRILNRFTNDQTTLDESIGGDLFDTVQCSIYAFAILIFIVYKSCWTLPFMGILIFPVKILRYKFVNASRKCKRVEGVLRSPVYSLLGSTLQGLPEIRSLKHIDTFQALFVSYLDSHTSVSFCYQAISRWIGIWIDGLFCFFYLFLCLAFILLKYYSKNSFFRYFPLKDIGLSLMYTQQLCGLVQWVIRQSSEVENLMTSAERVLEYTQLEDEDKSSSTASDQLITPPPDWPKTGAISIERMRLTYPFKKEPVLKGVSLQILDGEDVGLVGRTGAGKSSLIYALFRIFEPHPAESIKIDGIPISRISKSRLRQAIAIIPQEAIIFRNTIRFNLDPTGQATDEEMWCAIEQAQMKDSDYFPEGLDTIIDPNDGSSLSSGEKQLICLARAILMRRKIVVMDEATANVDLITTQKMQDAMKLAFAKSTVCTIAHRLHTIIEYDKVIVLDAGKVKEVEHPYILLSNPNSAFSQMVREQGKEHEENLIDMAKNSLKENYPQRYFDLYGASEAEEEVEANEGEVELKENGSELELQESQSTANEAEPQESQSTPNEADPQESQSTANDAELQTPTNQSTLDPKQNNFPSDDSQNPTEQ